MRSIWQDAMAGLKAAASIRRSAQSMGRAARHLAVSQPGGVKGDFRFGPHAQSAASIVP